MLQKIQRIISTDWIGRRLKVLSLFAFLILSPGILLLKRNGLLVGKHVRSRSITYLKRLKSWGPEPTELLSRHLKEFQIIKER